MESRNVPLPLAVPTCEMFPRRRSPYAWAFAAALVLVVGCSGIFIGLRKAIDYKTKLEEDMMREMMGELDRAFNGPSLKILKPRWEKGVLTVDLAFVNELDGKSTAKASLTKFSLDDYFCDLKLPYAVPPLKPGGSKTIRVRFPGFSGRGGKLAKVKTVVETTDGEKTWTSPKNFDLAVPLRRDRQG